MKFRLSISIGATVLFVALASLRISGLDHFYTNILGLWGIGVDFPGYEPFLDLSTVLSAGQCHQMGFDVYAENPCDPFGRPFLYSPVWFFTEFLNIGMPDANWIGVVLFVIFLITITSLIKGDTLFEKAIYTLAVFSESSVMAVERGNLDILMFSTIALAGWLWSIPGWRKCLSYSLIFMCAVLKLYPVVAFGVAIVERGRWLIGVAFLATVGWAVFIVCTWSALSEALPHAPKAPPLGDAFGGRNAFTALQHLMAQSFAVHIRDRTTTTFYVATVLAAIGLSFGIARSLVQKHPFQPIQGPSRALFLMSALIVLFSFFSTQNPQYRAIWLILLFPYLIILKKNAASQNINFLSTLIISISVTLLNFETFHVAILRLTQTPLAADMLAFGVREPLWWMLAVGLLTLLWIEFFRAPVVLALGENLSLRRARPLLPKHRFPCEGKSEDQIIACQS